MSQADLALPSRFAAPTAAEPTRRSDATAGPTPLLLRLVDGLHSGGEHALRDNDSLLIGSDAECDIVLADEGVMPRHCVVRRRGRRLSIRAITGAVTVGDERLDAGGLQALPARTAVGIGQARLMIATPQDWAAANRRGDLPDAPATPLLSWLGQLGLGATLVVALGLLAYALAHGDAQRPTDVTPELWLQKTAAVIDQLSLGELRAQLADDAGLQVTGIVPDDAAEQALRDTLTRNELPAAVAVRTGTEIAEDVRELLRLSGVEANTRYLGDGRVEAWGAFGDDGRLMRVVDSRAMREVDGLRQVVAHNVDHRDPPPPSLSPAKEVKYVVAGADPYVVTRDGSRYYLGAELPSGEQLVGVAADALQVARDGQVRTLPATGQRLDAPASR